MDDVFEKLREYMDEINPFGFPKTEDGSDLEFLKALFCPEEAGAYVHLRRHPEPLEVISRRLGRSAEETARILDGMYKKGLALKRTENDVTSYGAMVLGPGILEAVLVPADSEVLFKAVRYLVQGAGAAVVRNKTGLLRTIPVEIEIPAESKAQTYEKSSEIIRNAQRPLAVAKCSCRTLARRAGGGCDRPADNCIVFGDHARFQIEYGHGREIDEAEALKILREAEQAGLVHNIINFTDSEGASYLCNCCSCCCSTLVSINRLFPEGEICGLSPSNYVAAIDLDSCSGCELCESYCTLKALHFEDNLPVVNAIRCLGCGLCAANCPMEAIKLVRRPEEQMIEYPKTMDDLYDKVREEVRELYKSKSPQGA